tara:strand:+ start:5787 stop:7001 length:1215 start_codon:yes stop_codon:yes gene_type:complete
MNLAKLKKIKTTLVYFISVVSDVIKVFWYCIKNIVKNRKLFEDDLTIVTGSDFTHFQSVKNLLNSILEHEFNSKIIVYDLGFTKEQAEFLNRKYKNIQFHKFKFEKYPKFFSERSSEDNKLGSYAWKSAIVQEVISQSEGLVLWLDAGDKITKKLRLLKVVLTSQGIYLPRSAGKIKDWTHPKTIKLFNYEKLNENKRNLASGMIGFNSRNNLAKDIVNEWFEASQNKDLIAPPGSNRSNHRQDQSLLTIIFYKFESVNLSPSTHKIFGIIVHQDPNKIYLSPISQSNEFKEIRNKWYKLHQDISTNTLINADIVWMLDFSSIKKFPEKYLKKVYLVVNLDKKDKFLTEKVFDKYSEFFDFAFLYNDYGPVKKDLSHKSQISKSNYQKIFDDINSLISKQIDRE